MSVIIDTVNLEIVRIPIRQCPIGKALEAVQPIYRDAYPAPAITMKAHMLRSKAPCFH